ncbi:MAG: hypothetical protein AAFZ05_02170 [Pseudomonadota bacterium]
MAKSPGIDTKTAAPASLTGHDVPDERRAAMQANVAALEQAALAVSDRLPIDADARDIHAVMAADLARPKT